MDEHASLGVYVIIIPVTAVLAVIFGGLVWAALFLLGLAAELVRKASQNSHPINSQEEID